MARYGGGVEDFNEESAKLRALRSAREEVIRKEVQQTAASEDLGVAEAKSARATNAAKRARQEAAEVDARAARVSTQGAKAVDADTAAIERNTRARQRQAATQRQAVAGRAKGLVDQTAISDFQRYIQLMERADQIAHRSPSGSSPEATKVRREAEAIRRQIAGVQPLPSLGGGTRVGGPSSRPGAFSATWIKQLEAAMQSPNFRFTPNQALVQQISGLQPRLLSPGKYDIRQAQGGESVFGGKTFKSEADAQAQIEAAQRAMARATSDAATAARQVAQREKQAVAATDQVVAAKNREAASTTESAAAAGRYTRETTARGATVFRDPAGRILRRSPTGHEYSHVVVDDQGEPVSFHNSEQLAQKAMQGRRARRADHIEPIYENEAQAAKKQAEDTSFAARKDAEVQAKVQAAKERAAAQAQAAADATSQQVEIAKVEAVDMRDSAARMAAIRRERETIAASEVAARERQAVAANADLIRHPTLFGGSGARVPTSDPVDNAGRSRSLAQAARESSPVAMSRLERAELEYAAALNRQRNAYNRLTTAPDDAFRQRAVEDAAQEAAQARQVRDELRAELAARRKKIEAINASTQAEAQSAVVAREGAAATAFGGGPGAGIILHPDEQVRRAYASQQPIRENVERTFSGRSLRDSAAATAIPDASAVNASAAAHQAKAKAVMEEQVSLGNLTAAEEAYIAALGHQKVADLEALAAEAQVAKGNIATRSTAAAAALQREGAALGTVSQAMHKHGALTSEFILATARGETTLRELGNQAVITAGKFGGWTAAATALFGAAAAIGKVGHGAILASSGVHQLQRVINNVQPDQAQQAFADLSRQFNVPIDDAIDAVYRMGQRFHDLPSAIEASKAALYSLKTGEVDVATSTENLIAITNGFGLSAKDLTSVYDQINQAQNTFGVRIGDTEAGLAKAGGTFRNAGGDLNYLLGLFTAISRATNRSGQEIGTAISRAPSQLRRKGAVEFLKSQGVNADPREVQKTIQSAMDVVRKNPGADIRGIAQSILGNQYARLLEPVLRDQSVLNQALRDTSPEQSKNSAQKELAKVLSEVREQISSMGNELQRLGAALNQAGFFNFAGIFLKSLTTSLGLATHLVEIFNNLPSPIRQAAVMLGELAVAMKVLRRFGATERLAGTSLGFLANPERQYAVRTRQGLRSNAQAARDAQERAQQQSFNAAQRAAVAQEQAQAASAVHGEAERQLAIAPPGQRIAASQAVDEANRNLVAADERAAALAAQARVVAQEAETERLLANRAEAAEIAATQVHITQMRAYAESLGYAVPLSATPPNTLGVDRPIAKKAGVIEEAAAFRIASGAEHSADALPAGVDSAAKLREALPETKAGERLTAAAAAAAVPEQFTKAAPRELTDRARRITNRLTGWYAGMTGVTREISTGEEALSSESAKVGRTAGKLRDIRDAGAHHAIDGIGAAVTGLEGMRKGVGGLWSSIKEFGSSLGALDYALIGFIGFEAINSALDNINKKVEDADRELASFDPKRSRGDYRRQARDLAAPVGSSNRARDSIEFLNQTANPINMPGTLVREIGALAGLNDYETPQQKRQRLIQEANDSAYHQRLVGQIQARERHAGHFQTELTYGQLHAAIDRDAQDRKAGIISAAEFDRRMGLHAQEAKHLVMETSDRDRARAQLDLAAANRAPGTPISRYRTSLRGLDPKGLQGEVEANLSLINDLGPSRDRMARLRAAYAQQISILAGDNSAQGIKALSDAQNAMVQGITQNAQSELESALATAPNEQARRHAYAVATQRIRQNVLGPSQRAYSAAQDHLTEAQVRAEATRRAAQAGPQFNTQPFGARGDFGLNSLGAVPTAENGATVDSLRQAAEDDAKTVNGLKRNLSNLKEPLQAARRAMHKALEALRDPAYQDRQSGREGDLALSQSQTASASEQATLAVAAAAAQLRDARRTYHSKNSRQYQAALTQLNQAQTQQAQSVLSDVEADNALLVARAGPDPVDQARAAVTAAQNTLRAMQANASRLDPNAIKNQRAQVITAQTALDQAQVQQSTQLAQLYGQLAETRAVGDPVTAAHAAQRAAHAALANARTRVERVEALIAIAQADQQLIDAFHAVNDSRYGYLESLTTDPVKIANLERQKSARDIQGTKGINRQDARAQHNRDVQSFREAKLTSAEDDIDFEKEMGRITTESAIQRYQGLLRWHNLSKADRRNILLKIHQLQQDSESEASGFDLNVGNIRMPTIYDVRKAWDPVRKQRQAAERAARAYDPASLNDSPKYRAGIVNEVRANVSHLHDSRAEVQANISVVVTDPHAAGAVYRAIDRALGTTVRARMRSAGLRG